MAIQVSGTCIASPTRNMRDTTVCMWVKFDSASAVCWPIVFMFGTGFWDFSGLGRESGGQTYLKDFTSNLGPTHNGLWLFLGYRVASDGATTAFIGARRHGGKDAIWIEEESTHVFANATCNVNFGGVDPTNRFGFVDGVDGQIARATIFDGVLDLDDLLAVMADTGVPAGCWAHYEFADNATKLADTSGNGRTATLEAGTPSDGDTVIAALPDPTTLDLNIGCGVQSLTSGFGGVDSYVDTLATLRPSDTATNYGIAGNTTDLAISNLFTNVLPDWVAADANVFVGWEYTNDDINNLTGAQQITGTATLTRYLQARGWYVIWVTGIPYIASGTPWDSTALATLNAAILSLSLDDETLDWAVDLNGVTELQNPNDTTYFQGDKVHFTLTATEDIVAPAINSAIDDWLADLADTSVSATVSVNIAGDFSVSATVSSAQNITSTSAWSIENDFSVSASASEIISSTGALSIGNDFVLSLSILETITSTSASQIQQDLVVSSSVIESIPSAVAASIASDFTVNVSGSETIVSTSSSTITDDFVPATSITVNNPGSSSIEVNIDQDFSVSSSVTESIQTTSALNIDQDFSVSGSITESVPSTVAAVITTDFVPTTSVTVNNPGTSTITVNIEQDFAFSSTVTETVPGSVACSIDQDFSVSCSLSESNSAAISAIITSDITVSASQTVANPVTATISTFITDDFSVSASINSLSSGDFTVSVNIDPDFSVSASCVESIPASTSVSIANDFVLASSISSSANISSIVDISVTNDFIPAASLSLSVGSIAAAVITDDLLVESLAVLSYQTSVAFTIDSDFTVSSVLQQANAGFVSVDITPNFSVSSNSLVAQEVTAVITINLGSLIDADSSISILNPSVIQPGVRLGAVWLKPDLPVAKWL